MASTFKNGGVKIANDVIDQLAVRASEEISGVRSGKESDGKINLSANLSPKANIESVDGKLHIDLIVNLHNNVNVRKTVKEVQENVVRVIESMTGIPVARVNVTVPRLDI